MPDSSTGTPRPAWYPWYVVAVLTLFSVSGNIDQQILSLLVRPMERDLGITDSQVSYLSGFAFALFFTVLGLPIARLADRTSRRNVMAGGAALWSVFTSLCAAAKTFPHAVPHADGRRRRRSLTQRSGRVAALRLFLAREFAGAMSVLSSGIFIGSGAGYAIGGYMVGRRETRRRSGKSRCSARYTRGSSCFSPLDCLGCIVALLLLTVREPPRERNATASVPRFSVLISHVARHRRTFATQSSGFAMSSSVNFALVLWIPAVFMRRFAWNEAQTGQLQGLLTIIIGPIGVLVGGWLANSLTERGRTDAPLRVGMIGAAGMLVAATAFPLAPTATMAGWWLAVVNLFAAMPWGAANAAAAEIVPPKLRAQGVALYILVVFLFSRSIGPASVGWLNDYVFHDPMAIGRSLAIVNVVGMTTAIILFALGLAPFRRTIAELDAAERS